MGERYKSYGMKGKKHSLEVIERMKKAHKSNPTSFWVGKKLSEAHRKKISESHKGRIPWNKGKRGLNCGDKNPAWKSGVSSINSRIRASADFKLWRTSIFIRDDYTCVWCLKRGGILNADHIKPFSKYPALRFAIDNGRTLCVPCHKKTDTYGRKTK